ncbi:MAG: leucyl aminopeptidase family protein [Flavobacteriales bacterium]|nr:leucyl aminopeptidase family protein [Flavobacteriales bacterium]MCX7768566.1 leucyl aminopeptidase family protein [Flavobacteriales bacterium]MDW8409465.1 leucyl aminopeptidase family protein [Flavobacteriales bacterium]
MPIRFKTQPVKNAPPLHVIRPENVEKLPVSESVRQFLRNQVNDQEPKLYSFPLFPGHFLVASVPKKEGADATEAQRGLGSALWREVHQAGLDAANLNTEADLGVAAEHLVEGLILAAYSFDKYKRKSKEFVPFTLAGLDKNGATSAAALQTALGQLRDWVNEPYNHLHAEAFAFQAAEFLQSVGVDVEVFGRKKISSLRMGGLLGVNQGSAREPRFVVAHYKPARSINRQPIVLVGKGVMFDTGGASIKNASGMMTMKNDMAGAALVLCTIWLAAELQWPMNLVALVPLTDNMVGPTSLVPGDIITISDGTTVEVLNTDAEGRLILADALVYARRFKPALVLDTATLTGAVVRALGEVAAGAFEKDAGRYKEFLQTASEKTAERLVWFPLWKVYGESLKSEVADLKNIGGQEAGHITAAKFLEHFTNYPWIHLDIAGVAYSEKGHPVRGKGATGWGLLLLKEFMLQICSDPNHA